MKEEKEAKIIIRRPKIPSVASQGLKKFQTNAL
jgi:hypothetical protein